MNIKVIILSIILILPLESFSSFAPDYKELNWDGVEVIWVEDNQLPLYQIDFYFADGALSDRKGKEGETELAFDLLTSGTRSFNQREINDNLEYYGVSYGHHITHEYLTYSVGGLAKDIVPSIKQICHIFSDATFPKEELRKVKKLKINGLNNILNDHSSVADRAFRKLSLDKTAYRNPTGGTIKSLKKITRKDLLNKIKYFMGDVKKRVYIKGPKSIIKVKDIITHECGFDLKNSSFVRTEKTLIEKKRQTRPNIFLVTVPQSNQAQVRIGRVLSKDEIKDDALLLMTSKFLGGGFTSQLMKNIRTKAGLSYSVSAFAAGQKEYGRSGIMTFTKNKTVGELLDVIKNTLSDVEKGKFTEKEFKQSKGYLIGSFPFAFEKTSHFIESLIQMDHQEKPHENLFDLPKKLKKFSKEDVSKKSLEVFDWNQQTIVVVGPKSLKKDLKRFGKVEVINYKKFL